LVGIGTAVGDPLITECGLVGGGELPDTTGATVPKRLRTILPDPVSITIVSGGTREMDHDPLREIESIRLISYVVTVGELDPAGGGS